MLKRWNGTAWVPVVVGAKGEHGEPGLVVGSTPPASTDTIWADTSTPALDLDSQYAPLQLIGTVVTTAGATSVGWASIPQTFKALVIGWQAANVSTASGNVNIAFNNDNAANYDFAWSQRSSDNTGGNAASEAATFGGAIGRSTTDGASGQITVPAYAVSGAGRKGAHGTTLATASTSGTPRIYVFTNGVGWRNDAAIDRVTLYSPGGGWVAGSTFHLWGQA